MNAVMAGLVPAIHVLRCMKYVDARDKPGHDSRESDLPRAYAFNSTVLNSAGKMTSSSSTSSE